MTDRKRIGGSGYGTGEPKPGLQLRGAIQWAPILGLVIWVLIVWAVIKMM